MTYDYVSIQREGRVAIVTFDRGNPLNALSLRAIEELTDAARNLERDLEISAIVLTTPSGSGFSAGRDLADAAADRRRALPMLERRHAAGAGKRLCAAWESIEVISSLKYAPDRPPVGIADALRISEKVQADAVSCDQK